MEPARPRGQPPGGTPDVGLPSPTRRGHMLTSSPQRGAPRTPGTSLQVSSLPWAGPDPTAGVPGRVRLQEPRLLAGHAWHGARSRLSALGLSPAPRLWLCRPREPREREGRWPSLDGGASLGAGTAGFWGAAPGGPGGRGPGGHAYSPSRRQKGWCWAVGS